LTTGVMLHCIIVVNMKRLIIVLLAALLLLSTACAPVMVAVDTPNLDGITEFLGYSLAPTQLPEGYEFDKYNLQGVDELVASLMEELSAILVYEKHENNATNEFIIHYPADFPSSESDDLVLEKLGLEWQRPDDAVLEVEVNGKTAHFFQGNWSLESFSHLINPDTEFLATYTPEWDYDMYPMLFFDFELSSGETVGVTISDSIHTGERVTPEELIKIAESMQQVD